MDFWMDSLARAGVEEVVVNSHAHSDWVTRYVARVKEQCPFLLSEAYEVTLKGSAGAITANRGLAAHADSVAIIYGDNFSSVSLNEAWKVHEAGSLPVTMVLFRPKNAEQASAVTTAYDGVVTSFKEKAPAGTPSMGAFAGILIVSSDAYREIADMQAYDIGYGVLPKLVGQMRALVAGATHIDIGLPENFSEASEEARKVELDFPTTREAVFFDRDGTLIQNNLGLKDPSLIKLLPGAATAVKLCNEAGYMTVLTTNQAGVAKGYLTKADVEVVNVRLKEMLAAEGARLDAAYYCAEQMTTEDRNVMEHVDRKPGPGMLWQACVEHGLDLRHSWMIGDMESDVLAGKAAGCAGQFLVTPETGPSALQAVESILLAVAS